MSRIKGNTGMKWNTQWREASCVHVIATSHQGGWLPPIYPASYHPRLYTLSVVFLLTSSIHNLLSLSPHLSISVPFIPLSRLHTLGPPLDPHATRVVCPVRPFALAFLYARWATRRQLARDIYKERKRERKGEGGKSSKETQRTSACIKG